MGSINTSLSNITTSLGQKLQARALSLAQNGYITLTNNLCIQWGRTSYGTLSSNETSITFPVAFTSVYSVVSVWQKGDTTTREWNVYGQPTTTGFKMRRNNGNDSSAGYMWVAIGKKTS